MTWGKSSQERQRVYYEETAAAYRTLHEQEDSPHDKALEFIARLLPGLEARSLLDVGAGTGRALRFMQQRFPDLHLRGIEPVAAMAREAENDGLSPGIISVGDGAHLPFDDGAFDVVTTFGVLHHVPQPDILIRELTRVARRAIFISDSNRFGQGRPVARIVKLALDAAGLWPTFEKLRTRGRGYHESAGDGIFYSYSVFDSLSVLRAWTPHLLFVEVENASTVAGPWGDPLCNASTLLVGALKQD